MFIERLSSRPQRSAEPGQAATAPQTFLGPGASAGIAALFACLFLAATPARADTAITDASARAFVARQQEAWNAGALDRFFGAFTPDARFTDQALGNDNKIVPYGVSTVAQARTQARKTLAKAKVRETTAITAISMAPDARSARVTARTNSRIAAAGAPPRQVCAIRVASVALTPFGLRTTGQTDTIVRCRAGAVR